MSDTYEGRAAWLRTVKNAKQAGALDGSGVIHQEARTLAEISAMREQNRELGRLSFLMPDCTHIFTKGKQDER